MSGSSSDDSDSHKHELDFILNEAQQQSKLSARPRSEWTKEEKKRGRMCKVEECTNYIVHKGLCCRHGVRHPLQFVSVAGGANSDLYMATSRSSCCFVCIRAERSARSRPATPAPSTRAGVGSTVRSLPIHLSADETD